MSSPGDGQTPGTGPGTGADCPQTQKTHRSPGCPSIHGKNLYTNGGSDLSCTSVSESVTATPQVDDPSLLVTIGDPDTCAPLRASTGVTVADIPIIQPGGSDFAQTADRGCVGVNVSMIQPDGCGIAKTVGEGCGGVDVTVIQPGGSEFAETADAGSGALSGSMIKPGSSGLTQAADTGCGAVDLTITHPGASGSTKTTAKRCGGVDGSMVDLIGHKPIQKADAGCGGVDVPVLQPDGSGIAKTTGKGCGGVDCSMIQPGGSGRAKATGEGCGGVDVTVIQPGGSGLTQTADKRCGGVNVPIIQPNGYEFAQTADEGCIGGVDGSMVKPGGSGLTQTTAQTECGGVDDSPHDHNARDRGEASQVRPSPPAVCELRSQAPPPPLLPGDAAATRGARPRRSPSACSSTPTDDNFEQLRVSSDEAVTSTDSHCHSLKPKQKLDTKARRKLIIASVLCLVFMVGETAGGLLAGSLAIISDAAHLLTDFASFMISLTALYLAQRPSTKRLNFGWYRVEILGALLSILMLWVLTGILVYSAAERILSGDYDINASIMLITSATGVAFNILLGTTLHQHTHSHGGGGHGHSHGGGQGHSHDEGHGHSDSSQDLHRKRSRQSLAESPIGVPSNNSNPESNGDVYVTVQGSGERSSLQSSSGRGYGAVPEVSVARAAGLKDGADEDDTEKSFLLRSRSVSSTSDADTHGGRHHKKHKGSNINVKAAFVHVLGDLFQSIGVLVAAFIIYFKPEWKIADPICTFLFSVFVLITTLSILRDIIVVLMEGTPKGINFAEVREAFFQVDGVLDIHNLRVWSLTTDKIALSVHIAVDRTSDPHQVLREASRTIQSKFAISETTMQIEEYVTEMGDCVDCQGPKL